MNKIVSTAITIYILTGLVLAPKLCTEAAGEGIVLCIKVIIPSLFPFFVCSKILISNGFAEFISKPFSLLMPVFKVPPCGGFAFIMGIISGCPVGAKTVMDLYSQGLCTKTEAQRMVCFCNNSGPLFIMSAVAASMLGISECGVILYTSHILSAVAVGIIMSFYRRDNQNMITAFPQQRKKSFLNFGEIISESVALTGYVCGFVIFFAVAIGILQYSGFLEGITANHSGGGLLCGILYGMLEMTNGINLLCEYPLSSTLLCCISFVAGFGGLSVIMQVSGIISEYGLSPTTFTFAKLLQGIISAAITGVLIKYSDFTLPVFAKSCQQGLSFYWANSIKFFAFFGIIIFILSILSIGCKKLRRM